jgi:hypothetical protein
MSESFKVVKGAKYQKRPSASYFYKELKVPVGYIVEYRPRKGGKMIKHSLQLRKNGTPYWKAEEKLPVKKGSKKRKPRTKRFSTKRRSNKMRSNKMRSTKRTKKRSSKRSSGLRGGGMS